jgi:hypothetical protein
MPPSSVSTAAASLAGHGGDLARLRVRARVRARVRVRLRLSVGVRLRVG